MQYFRNENVFIYLIISSFHPFFPFSKFEILKLDQELFYILYYKIVLSKVLIFYQATFMMKYLKKLTSTFTWLAPPPPYF